MTPEEMAKIQAEAIEHFERLALWLDDQQGQMEGLRVALAACLHHPQMPEPLRTAVLSDLNSWLELMKGDAEARKRIAGFLQVRKALFPGSGADAPGSGGTPH